MLPRSSRIRLSLCFSAVLFIITLLRLIIPDNASPEYEYTIRQIFRYSLAPLLLATFWIWPGRFSIAAKILLSLAAVFFAIPSISPSALLLPWRLGQALSICWIGGSFCAALGLFFAASGRNGVIAGISCLLGSICLAFCLGESWLLFTDQAQDDIVNDTANSKYISRPNTGSYGDNIARLPYGDFPTGNGSPHYEASRLLKQDEQLFDVLYSFDGRGRRAAPTHSRQPHYELMLFGCSFTFGVGLDDEQTWAWKLADLLGPDWKLENYAYAGFGPQQMLSLLEEGAIETPVAPKRQALYFAIEDQLRRNAGLVYKRSIHYALSADGSLKRDGMTTDTLNAAICVLPKYLNGSQLARYLSLGAVLFLAGKNHGELERVYVAIIEEASRLLQTKYNAPLTVLLWPDVEYLADELRKHDIAVLLAKSLLPEWDKNNGRDYLIHPKWEWHPNAKAATEIASGLASYYRSLQ